MLLSERAKRIGKRVLVDGRYERTDSNGLTIICRGKDDFTPMQLIKKQGCSYCQEDKLHTVLLHDEVFYG